MFHEAKCLRWVHTAGVGVEPLLSSEVVSSEVMITNSGGVYERPMAEYAVMLMLQMAKDSVRTWQDQQVHKWNKRSTTSLDRRVVLIVGAGPIGRAIARLSRAFGMIPLGVARSQREGDDDFDFIYASRELLDVLGRADYVVLVAPLTIATAGVFGREALDRMKPSARLLNLGRGGLVDEAALFEALAKERIAGAALDVFQEEPLPPAHPFWQLPNAIISPHMSGDVEDTAERFVGSFLENLHLWIAGKPLHYVVDKTLGFRPGGVMTVANADAKRGNQRA
jgi:phosphoglycerate dehydrogenase-like enzyme